MDAYIIAFWLLNLVAGGLLGHYSSSRLRWKVLQSVILAIVLYALVICISQGLLKFHSVRYTLQALPYHVIPFVMCFLLPNLLAAVSATLMKRNRRA